LILDSEARKQLPMNWKNAKKQKKSDSGRHFVKETVMNHDMIETGTVTATTIAVGTITVIESAAEVNTIEDANDSFAVKSIMYRAVTHSLLRIQEKSGIHD
jgi:hypothetical protein